MCKAYISLYEHEKSIESLQKYIDILQATGDRAGLGWVYAAIGVAYYAYSTTVGQCEKSLEYLKNSVQLHTETVDRQGVEMSSIGLAGLYLALREYEKATEYVNKALQISKENVGRMGKLFALRSSVKFTVLEDKMKLQYGI